MLEILYDIGTKEVRAWNADMEVKGNLKAKEGQEVVIFPIDPPNFLSDWYKVDLENQTIIGNPDYVGRTPPLSTHPARLDAINPGVLKPATVTRIFLTEAGFTTLWYGKEYSYDCYVTQSIVDEWQAGKIAVGDLVLIFFLEDDISKPILTHKIFRSW